MTTEFLEIGLTPACVHTARREKKYYLMKRFVKAAVKATEKGIDVGVKVVAILYETPYNFLVMVNRDARLDKVANIFCTHEFTEDERREILMNLDIRTIESMESETQARGYKLNSSPVTAVVIF